MNFARIDSRMNAMESRLGEFRHEMRAEFSEHRRETQTSLGEVRIALAGVDSKIDRRFADFVKWSFLFWCGAVAAAALARV